MSVTASNRVLSGMRPTGQLHLGHYHGVLKNWAKLQYEHDCYFFVADWHALTTAYEDPRIIQQSVFAMVVDWLTRLRIQEDAQHSFSNTIDVSYGLRDNLTLTTSLPLIYKLDTLGSKKALGLGDMSFGLRWQPIPLKRGLPSTTLFTSLSTATGDSPYEINASRDLSTGKGYYSLSGGVSMSKVTDPIVIYGSTSFSIANRISGLNQARGDKALSSVSPGNTLGFSFGFAYSLNYDVSMSASYQHSISSNSRYAFSDGTSVEPAAQVSSSLNYTLSLRTTPSGLLTSVWAMA